MSRRSMGPVFAIVVAALVFTLPETGLSKFGPFSVTGTNWDVAGKIKAKVKGVGKTKEDVTASVRFLSDTLLELEDSEGNLIQADYTGGQIDEDGKGSKKLTVVLTPQQLDSAEAELAEFATDLAVENGLPAITPTIEITKQKVKGKLAKNGELLKVKAKFKFTASALGQSANGKFQIKAKGPQAPSE